MLLKNGNDIQKYRVDGGPALENNGDFETSCILDNRVLLRFMNQ